jgi:hypothetical protein
MPCSAAAGAADAAHPGEQQKTATAAMIALSGLDFMYGGPELMTTGAHSIVPPQFAGILMQQRVFVTVPCAQTAA